MKLTISSSAQLSTHFKSLRKAKGWSQAELGQRLGIGQARVAQIERDPGSISVDKFLQILHLLDAKLVIDAQAEPTRHQVEQARRVFVSHSARASSDSTPPSNAAKTTLAHKVLAKLEGLDSGSYAKRAGVRPNSADDSDTPQPDIVSIATQPGSGKSGYAVVQTRSASAQRNPAEDGLSPSSKPSSKLPKASSPKKKW